MGGVRGLPSHGYRPPTNPARVLPERRPPLVADSRRAPVLVSRMDDATRQRFNAALAAFLAADALVRATTANTAYGVPVPHDVVTAWESARDEFDFQREGARR